jgi:SAM-dependent methyltransferase
MTKTTRSQPPTPKTGFWEGESLELGRRYAYPPESLPLLLNYLGAQAQMRILDVGCGSGFLTRLLARSLPEVNVVGLDADEKLLELAHQQLAEEGLENRVELLQGNAYELPFEPESFDLTTSYTVLCIMSDPMKALREQIRVTRKGGYVSAVTCFCHTDNLPHYHGRYPLPGNHRVDELNYQLWRTWRQAIRPRLLDVDHDIVNQDILWQFRASGLKDIRIDGHLMLFSPGDDRVSVEEGAAYALASHRLTLERLENWRREHGEELAEAGFSSEDFEELLELKRARYEYLQEDPARIREVMEVFTDPLIITRGTKD